MGQDGLALTPAASEGSALVTRISSNFCNEFKGDGGKSGGDLTEMANHH